MNKIEALKAEKDGLDVWPDVLRYASANVSIHDIPEADLQRMKWYGFFYRPQVPGTFMVRLRIGGGQLSSGQLRTIAHLVQEFGHGSADLTTRQNIQLRGIVLRDIPTIRERLESVGLGSMQTGLDNVRNHIGCPLAGIDGLELFDTTPVLQQLTKAHLGLRAFSNLPRKFNVSVAGCREDCGHAETQDLGFVPATSSVAGRRVAGFNAVVGGALGGTSPRLATPLDAFFEPDDVPRLFTAILEVFRDHGPREVRTKARLKWLLDEWGNERFRDEVERRFGPMLPAGDDERTRVAGDHLGVHPQRQVGMHYVGLHVPVGRIEALQLRELAALADRYGAGELRLTTEQNVIIPHVSEGQLDGLLSEPLLAALRPDPAPVWRNLVACTGTDYCHHSLIDTKTQAVELARELEARGTPVPEGARIHVSGCVHACGKHHVADIGLQGAKVRQNGEVVEAADISTGGCLGTDGRLASPTLAKVPMVRLSDEIDRLLREQDARHAAELKPATA